MNPDPPLSVPASPPARHLLDVNVLLAAIWSDHPQHAKAFAWLSGKSVMLCPLSELGFLRISTNKKAIHAPMAKARELLNRFATDRKAVRIAADARVTMTSIPVSLEPSLAANVGPNHVQPGRHVPFELV